MRGRAAMTTTTHPTELHVRVLDLGEMTVVGLDGSMDATNSARVCEQLQKALDRDSTTIVLDCSLLRSLGHREVAVLADANDTIRDHHGRFVVRQPNPSARELMAEDGLLDEIEVED
jgi:anti-anti-sigma factor